MTQAKKNSCQSTLREKGRGVNGVGGKRDDGWMEWEEWKGRRRGWEEGSERNRKWEEVGERGGDGRWEKSRGRPFECVQVV